MKTLLHLLYCILLLSLLSCAKEEEAQPAATRTVLVYLGGDNNLSGEVSQKLDSITAGWHNRRDHLLVYKAARNETPSLLQIVGHPTHPYHQLIKEYKGMNAADATAFSTVVQDVLSMYPSPGYGLLVFSHGTGWLPQGMFTRPRSLSVHSIINDNGREMEIAAFARALPDHTFDFIVMEACLMASVEVAYELRNKAEYLVASSAEILSPGFTPVYPELINTLFEQPQANLPAFAQCYYRHCNSRSGIYRSATVSVLNLSAMEELAEVSRSVYSTLSGAADGAEAAESVQCFDRGSNRLFFDYADYMEHLSPAAMFPAVEAALAKVVVYQAATPLFVSIPIRRHSGLTTYIEQSRYPELNSAYSETAWFRAVHPNY